jgi:hypothetical protein
MKPASQSSALNISKTLAQRIDTFARVAGVTPDQMVNDLLEAHFAPDRYMDSLQRYIYDRGAGEGHYPKAQADRLANNYNAFAKAETERTRQCLTSEAKVESTRDGSFRLWFPLIRTSQREAVAA